MAKITSTRTYPASMKRLHAPGRRSVTEARVKALRDGMIAPEAQGRIALKVGRQVLAFAESEELIATGSNVTGSANFAAMVAHAGAQANHMMVGQLRLAHLTDRGLRPIGFPGAGPLPAPCAATFSW